MYARCSDGSKNGYLLVSNVDEHKDSGAKFRTVPPRLQLTFLSRANWHSARARAQSRLATPTHASGMCKVFIITII